MVENIAASSGGVNWGCLGNACLPTPGAATSFNQLLTVKNLIGGAAVQGVTVKVCARTDASCAHPLSTLTSAADGTATASLPVTAGVGFDGYLDMSGGGILPALFYPYPPWVADSGGSKRLNVSTPGQFSLFAGLAGATLDDTRGHVGMVAYDCGLQKAPGVALTASTADASSTREYTRNNLPNSSVTETGPDGGGGFINLPVGPVTITGVRSDNQAHVGTITVQIRAGTLTTASFSPGN